MLLPADDTCLVLVDVQGRLARIVHDSAVMVARQRILLQAMTLLEVPVLWNEQLPDKLGQTLPELRELLEGEPLIKHCFACTGNPDFAAALADLDRSHVLVAGIETHVCVWQTVDRLCGQGHGVHVLADACASRSPLDHTLALERMRARGAEISSVEMALFELMEDARHPAFRQVTGLLK